MKKLINKKIYNNVISSLIKLIFIYHICLFFLGYVMVEAAIPCAQGSGPAVRFAVGGV